MLNIERKSNGILEVSIALKKALEKIETYANCESLEYQINESVRKDTDANVEYSQIEFVTKDTDGFFRGLITEQMRVSGKYKHVETVTSFNKVYTTFTRGI